MTITYGGKSVDQTITVYASQDDADIAADVALVVASAAGGVTTYSLPSATNGSTITYTATTAGTKVTAAGTGNYEVNGTISGALTLASGTGSDAVISVSVTKGSGVEVTKTITIKDNADASKADITVE